MTTLDDVCRERISEVRAWASSRIDECRRQEQKFGSVNGSWQRRGHHQPPQALIEAWTEAGRWT